MQSFSVNGLREAVIPDKTANKWELSAGLVSFVSAEAWLAGDDFLSSAAVCSAASQLAGPSLEGAIVKKREHPP